jgi:hypothetical protein
VHAPSYVSLHVYTFMYVRTDPQYSYATPLLHPAAKPIVDGEEICFGPFDWVDGPKKIGPFSFDHLDPKK